MKKDRSLSYKVSRLLMARRAIKKLEEMNEELKAEIIDRMVADGLERIKVPSGTVTCYEERVESISAERLFRRYGKKALEVMSVKIGEARRLFGEKALRADKLIKFVEDRDKLLARPAPEPKSLKVAC